MNEIMRGRNTKNKDNFHTHIVPNAFAQTKYSPSGENIEQYIIVSLSKI